MAQLSYALAHLSIEEVLVGRDRNDAYDLEPDSFECQTLGTESLDAGVELGTLLRAVGERSKPFD